MPHKGLQSHPPIIPSSAQVECEAKGGTFDPNTQTCIMPPIKTPEIIRDQDTGKPSAITLPSGETFFGTQKDLDEIAASKAARDPRALPAGTLESGTAQRTAEDTQRKIRLARTVGQIDFDLASQLEEQGINIREAFFAGVQGIDIKQAGIATGAGAAVGATAAIPTAGLSVPAVAAIAGGSTLALDFFNDVRKNIKDQRQDLVSVKTKELRQRKTAMNNYIQAANMNPAEADDYVLAYNIEKSLIMRDFNTLVERGNEDLEFWGTDATPQIVEYEVFFESVQPSLDVRMEQAVLKPEPTRAFLSIGEEE